MPGHIYKLLSQEAKDAIQKYNVEAIQKFKASRNLNETELIHNVYEHAQEELPPTIDEEEFQECQEFNTDQDLEPPTDDLLDFITSMFGFLIPRNYIEALEFDKANNNSKWYATRLNWTPYIHIRYSRSMKKHNMKSKRK